MIWTMLSFSVRMTDFSTVIQMVVQHNIVSYSNINGAAGGGMLNGRTVSWTLLTRCFSHSYGCPLTFCHTHTELWLKMCVCVSERERVVKF